jgi:hypothetical protein
MMTTPRRVRVDRARAMVSRHRGRLGANLPPLAGPDPHDELAQRTSWLEAHGLARRGMTERIGRMRQTTLGLR